jgi:S-adenosylmethionine synthetase
VGNYLFTSESVCSGHPDKIADQIADAILDECLKQDPQSHVSCEVLLSSGLVVLAGEITTRGSLDYQAIARDVICHIGYDDCSLGFDYRSCGIISTINKQSEDIARGIGVDGAGDQGIMFGYASDETEELMPISIVLAHKIVRELEKLRKSNASTYLRPDGKAQVTIEFDKNGTPLRLHTVVISVQHSPNVARGTLIDDMKELVYRIVPHRLIDDSTLFYINPTGRFVIGGPVGDCGITGRKIIVDTYGGMGRHGGGSFSGKDPTKVDRTAAYAARYVAKNIVAAHLSKKCEVQISYAIGLPFPVSIKVDTFGTGLVSEELLAKAIPQVFTLTPRGMIDMLDLERPIFKKTAFGGHFGRSEPEFTWERTDKIEALRNYIKSQN